jgi:cytochrome c biogenesis protein CcdA
VDRGLAGLAFAAGLVAALNPCGFAMLPAYLLLVVRGQQAGQRSGLAALGRALAATIGMALGFLTVFGLFGALTISAATTVQRYLPYGTAVIGIVLVALGVWLLSGRELTALTPRSLGPRWAPDARLASMYGYGVSYAIASLSCTVGPFLAVTAAGFRTGSVFTGVSIYLAYVAGLSLVVGVLAIAAATALMVLVGLYVAYYGFYEVRLLSGQANPHDAVIAVAGRLQGALAAWVHKHGAWPWAVALVVVAAGAVGGAWYHRARHAHHNDT